jgi:hypothetical protein
MRLIGLSGYARSGKDTAYALLKESGWQKVAFAEPMREFLYRLNPIVDEDHTNNVIRIKEVIDSYGWDGYKETVHGAEMRGLMQRLGTECGRALLGDNIWIDTALNGLDAQGSYAVTDCRFVNEAFAIHQRGGKVIRINRPGVGPANAHISETGLDSYPFDAVVENDGSLENFKEKLEAVICELDLT